MGLFTVIGEPFFLRNKRSKLGKLGERLFFCLISIMTKISPERLIGKGLHWKSSTILKNTLKSRSIFSLS